MDLNEVAAEGARLSQTAHLATVGADNAPDVVPVQPGWADGVCWVMAHKGTVKLRNIAVNPNVALSWQVSENGDALEVWGTAVVADDRATRERVWNGVFPYDLDQFCSNGIDSPEVAFIAVTPSRAVAVKQFGLGGKSSWRR